jgi:light-regulated signal transduction histidine kinase (bacteriophytochrome)
MWRPSLASQANERGIALEVRPAPDLWIDIDPVRIREVLINLVTNALRYTPKGGRVSIGLSRNAGGLVVTWPTREPVFPRPELPRSSIASTRRPTRPGRASA